ncbi:hypothetical protein ACFT38_38895 [Streptomyces sp. NPDC056975]|uniref:hypothetical protein n=1 Tax=Streptomyces sp. NPDC056975 TaxID=3345985 RepID=UPI00362BECFB
MPADASSPSQPVLGQLCKHPEVVPKEMSGLLERLAEMPEPERGAGRGAHYIVIVKATK